MKNILTIILLVLMSSFTYSQDKVINGKVTDEDNIPLIGVSITVKGTNNNVYSDMDGEFRIQIKKPNAVLVFTSLGFKTIEKTIQGNSNLNVTMEADAHSLNEVVITGIRASNLAEVKAKRDATVVAEFITPEDIGNFSDTNVADALQRVAGVQIERDVDGVSGDRVSIRGIGPQFVGVTMNGRTPISAGNEGKSDFRKFNLNVIPTEIIAGAKIHKTAQAKEVSTNIGGTVDFTTIRPLDIKYKGGKNYFASINARGASNSTIDELDFGHRFSGVYGTKINNKLGVALSVIYADEDNQKDESGLRGITKGLSFIDENGTEYTNITAPRTLNNSLLRTNQVRLATSAAIQWKPSEKISIVLDYTRTTVEANSDRQVFQIGLGSTGATQLLGGRHVFNEGDLDFNGNVLTYISPSSEVDVRTILTNTNQFYDNHSTNNIVGINTTLKPFKKLKIISDISYSDLDFFQNLTQINHRIRGQDGAYDQTTLDIDLRGELPNYGLPAEAFDAASFDLFRVSRRLIRTKGFNYAGKVDFEYELAKNAKITFGTRYAVTDFEARQTTSSNTDSAQLSGLYGGVVADLNDSGAYDQLLGDITGVGFNGGNVAGLENGWIKVPGQAVLDLIPGFSNVDGGSIFDFDIDLEDVEEEENNLGFDARRSYGAEETSTDFFTQADIKTKFLDFPLALNFGVRAVRTGNKSRGFSGVQFEDAGTGNDVDDLEIDNFYYEVGTSRWDVLPSFNANFTLQKRTKLRLSAYRGVSRPKYVDLIPNNEITFLTNIDPVDAADLAGSALRGSIVSGNPELKPYTAWMYDTTLEVYTNNGGAFIFSAFYKDLKDYIVKAVTSNQTYPGEELLGIALPDELDGLLFDITKPINITDGQIYGFEVGLNQHLSFLPGFAKGFGIKANYSFVESEFDGDLGDQADGFPGTAKHNANGTLYYEKSGFSLRFTAAYRGDYLSNLGAIGGTTRADEPHYTEGNTTYGFTAKKSLFGKKLQLTAGVANFTGEDIRRYQGADKQNFSAYYSRDPIWKFGARYKF